LVLGKIATDHSKRGIELNQSGKNIRDKKELMDACVS
jgi:hypothetical protein